MNGTPLQVNGVRYARGLGTHAASEIVFDLGGKHKKFIAKVGIDDGGGAPGNAIFKVLLDGREAFNSGVLKFHDDAVPVSLDLTGVKELRLVTMLGNGSPEGDHTDWIEPRIDDIVLPGPVSHFSTAGFFAVPGAARTVANFNPGWRFHKGDVADAQNPAFDDANWDAANLPHGLEILGENESGGRNYQGPAWYRKKFDAAPDGGKVYLYFEAVMGKCTVWINGRKMAEHFGGYLPFAIDAGPALNADGKGNVVAVRADNSDDPTYPPGKPQDNLDFTYLGGIYRDVYLIRTPLLHVTLAELTSTVAGGGVFAATKDVNGNDADVEVRTEVANDGPEAKKLTVRSVIETAEGVDVIKEETTLDLPAGATKEITQALAPKNAHLWHPDDPYLHFLRTEIVENGKVVDTLKTRFGIRLFEMRGKDGFFVNKKFIGVKLSGVNRHQDYPYIGNALPNSGQWRDVKLLREGGCNVIRSAHYPMDPAFYDACDEFGMLVSDPIPGWQFFNTKGRDLRDAPLRRRAHDDPPRPQSPCTAPLGNGHERDARPARRRAAGAQQDRPRGGSLPRLLHRRRRARGQGGRNEFLLSRQRSEREFLHPRVRRWRRGRQFLFPQRHDPRPARMGRGAAHRPGDHPRG